MKRNLFLFLLLSLIILPLTAEESIPGIPNPAPGNNTLYKNALEINPTSDGYYIGYERLFPIGNNAIIFFDAKNTAESGEDFGRSGLSCRYSFRDTSLFSARVETAWIDGQHNIGTRLGYDNRFFGLAVTSIQSLSDPIIERTEETITNQTSSSTNTYSQRNGDFEVYDRSSTSTQTVVVRESRFATPDGLMVDLNFNLFRFFNFSLGWSRWESDNWEEDGLQSQLSCQLTSTDSIGGHYARVDDNEEGGVYYKKRFNSLQDIFRKGDPVEPGTDAPLLHRFASVPFSTPPIRLITAQSYVEQRTETRVNETHEDVLVYSPVNVPPVISGFVVDAWPLGGMPAGQIEVMQITANDPDGHLVSWSVTSNRDGLLGRGSWPFTFLSRTTNYTGNHVITVTVTDDSGGTCTSTQTISV